MASDGGGGLEAAAACATPGAWSPAATLQRVREAIAAFATERGWAKFHRPRSIMLALVGEIGELAECFQWKGDEGAEVGLPQFSDSEKVHVGEELADVLVCVLACVRASACPFLVAGRALTQVAAPGLNSRARCAPPTPLRAPTGTLFASQTSAESTSRARSRTSWPRIARNTRRTSATARATSIRRTLTPTRSNRLGGRDDRQPHTACARECLRSAALARWRIRADEGIKVHYSLGRITRICVPRPSS